MDEQRPQHQDSGLNQGSKSVKPAHSVMDSKVPKDFGETKETKAAKPELTPENRPETAQESVSAEREILAPGRSLVVADFTPPSRGVSEHIVRLAFAMGVPPRFLTGSSRGSGSGAAKAPMRLRAAVRSPLEGERAAGMALRAGHFDICGVKLPIAEANFSRQAKLTPPFERTLHGFSWLRDLAACGQAQQGAVTANRVMQAWESANPTTKIGKGAAWKVEHAGRRMLHWLIQPELILSACDTQTRENRLALMEKNARWLDRNMGKAQDPLARLAGWCGIVAAGLILPDGRARRLFGEAGLLRHLGEFISDDGGNVARSPLVQIDALRLLIDLNACYAARKIDLPPALSAIIQLLVPPLLSVIHSDGALANWQGASAQSAERMEQLLSASAIRTRPLKNVRQWGYQRVKAGKATLIFDAAPPPLARNARYGCASTLAFEFCSGDHRIIVNCGGAAMAGGQLAAKAELGLRATAAHSALVLGNANSTAVKRGGRLGAGVGQVDVDRRIVSLKQGQATRLVASHDGYAARHGLLHRRNLIIRNDGSELRGEDVLIPSAKRAKSGFLDFALRFHIGQHVDLHLSDDGKGAGLILSNGEHWQFRLAAGDDSAKLTIEESIWVDGQGCPNPIEQLVVQGQMSRGGGNTSWLLKKMG